MIFWLFRRECSFSSQHSLITILVTIQFSLCPRNTMASFHLQGLTTSAQKELTSLRNHPLLPDALSKGHSYQHKSSSSKRKEPNKLTIDQLLNNSKKAVWLEIEAEGRMHIRVVRILVGISNIRLKLFRMEQICTEVMASIRQVTEITRWHTETTIRLAIEIIIKLATGTMNLITETVAEDRSKFKGKRILLIVDTFTVLEHKIL